MSAKRFVVTVCFLALAASHADAQRVSEPRVSPVKPSELTDAQTQAIGRFARGEETLNIFRTCVRNVDLCRSWVPFAQYVISPANGIAPREKELLILRTSWLCRADYDWSHHVGAAKRAGLTDEDIDRITKGPDAPGWSGFDAALLRAVDELHRDQHVADATWAALRQRYSEAQMMDLIFTVGEYTMVSMFLNSAGVQLEPGYARMPKGGLR
jgi:alkylhydroperoxidase family enzyme